MDRQLLFSLEDHVNFLNKAVDNKPKAVFISSFGTYLGITYDGRDTTSWGEKYQLKIRSFMESIRSINNVKVLIGLANYTSCKGKLQCKDCEKTYARSLIRLMNHAELFPEFKWRMVNELHLKCTLFFYDDNIVGVSGGRNLTDSNWDDITFTLSSAEIKQLWAHISPIWNRSLDITDDNIRNILNDHEISEAGLKSVLDGYN